MEGKEGECCYRNGQRGQTQRRSPKRAVQKKETFANKNKKGVPEKNSGTPLTWIENKLSIYCYKVDIDLSVLALQKNMVANVYTIIKTMIERCFYACI